MPRKSTIKYIKNNRRSKSKRGGVNALWEVYTNPVYKNNAIEFIRNPNNNWNERIARKQKFVNLWGNNPDCTDVQFGEFKVNRWGGNDANGCGFNIWDANNKKFWIDIDTFFNIATKVKDESNCILGVCKGIDDNEKNNILLSINPEENRTPVKTPNFFLQLFPSGYKVTEGGTTITKTPEATPSATSSETPSETPSATPTATPSETPEATHEEKKIQKIIGRPPSGGNKKTTKRRKTRKTSKKSKKNKKKKQ